MIKKVQATCQRCKKPMEAEYFHDPENPIPLEMLDQMIKWLCCESCMRDLRRWVEPVPKPQRLPLPEPEDPRRGEARQVGQVGLPYADD